jgi:hypothetical protein
MHSLFFNDALFDYFVDEDGKPLGRNKARGRTSLSMHAQTRRAVLCCAVLRNVMTMRQLLVFQVVRNSTSGSEIISPNAVRQGEAQWDCPGLKGVPLENQGTVGMLGFWWWECSGFA